MAKSSRSQWVKDDYKYRRSRDFLLVNPVVNLVARVSYLAAPSLAPGSGKMIDPGNEVAGSTMINVTERNEFIKLEWRWPSLAQSVETNI